MLLQLARTDAREMAIPGCCLSAAPQSADGDTALPRGLRTLWRRGVVALCLLPALGTLVSSRQASAEEPPAMRFQRDLHYDQVERSLYGTFTIARQAIKETYESLITRRLEQKMKRIWLQNERRGFSHLAGEIDRDLRNSVETREDLRSAALSAAQFANGNGSGIKRAGLRKLLQQVGHADAVRWQLREDVGTLPARAFGGHVCLGIVLADGRLKQPPRNLIEGSRNRAGREIFREIRKQWSDCVTDLTEGSPIPPDRLNSMRRLRSEWEQVRGLAKGLAAPASTEYLQNVSRLIGALSTSVKREHIAQFLNDGGYSFPGGTVGDLLRHVLDYDLEIKPGTSGHLVMAGLTDAMIDAAKEEMAALDERIERLKAQNPAHNAALRQRLVPVGYSDKFAGKHGGIDSPAFGGGNRRTPLLAVK